MNRAKTIFGAAALASLVIGLNLLVLKQDIFQPLVLVPLALAILFALAWLAANAFAVVQVAAPQGKAFYGLDMAVKSILFLAICIVIYAFFEHRDSSWDLTQEGRRQLSPQTIQVLKNLDKDVAVTAFFLRIDDELVNIAREKTERFLEQCTRHTARLHVEFLDPQLDMQRLEAMQITHASTQGTVVLECGTRQKVITLGGATPRIEERDFTNGLINVIRDSQPKVCFLTGHGEREIDSTDDKNGASKFKELLTGESYQAQRIAIPIANPEIPADCDILVINGLGLQGPQSDIHPEELRAIEAYLNRGGRLLLMVDPWRRVLSAANQSEQLIPWLEKRYGIQVPNGIALSPKAKSAWLVEFTNDPSLFSDPPGQSDYMGCFNTAHAITRSFDQKMLFSAARAVKLAAQMPEGVAGMELVRTTPDFYLENDVASLMATGKAGKTNEEPQGPFPVAVAVTAKTNQPIGDSGQMRDARIVVVGDSEFTSNAQLPVIPGNFNLILNIMGWLSESEDLIAIRSTGKEEQPLLLSPRDQKVIIYIAVVATTQAVIVAGLITFFIRRKYQ